MKQKQTSNILNLTVLLVILSVLFSCERLRSDEIPYEGIVLTKSGEAVRDASNDFSLSLFSQIAESGTDNVFVSPLGVMMLNCMLANGANGDTYHEIVKTLCLSGLSKDEINNYYRTILNALIAADKKVSLSLANSLWTADGYSAKSQYKSVLKKVYGADVYSVDFSRNSAVDKINQWSNSKTAGMVPKVLDDVNSETVMMLANALYFQGEWTHKFKESQSATGTFSCLDGASSSVVYMHQATIEIKGYADDEVCVVRMPYGNGAFYMEAILPSSSDFSAFVRSLDKEKLGKWEQVNTEAIDLLFPKLDFTYDTGNYGLTQALHSMGMKLAFTKNADFSGISNSPVYVDQIRQKAAIIVDEGGTRAAASGITALRGSNMNREPVVTQMHFNTPFVYFIRESSTGAILFVGSKVK